MLKKYIYINWHVLLYFSENSKLKYRSGYEIEPIILRKFWKKYGINFFCGQTKFRPFMQRNSRSDFNSIFLIFIFKIQISLL